MSNDTSDTPKADAPTPDVDGETIDPELADEADEAVESEPDPNLVTINVNGREVPARKGDMVIAAALGADEYVPHFCYHPRMSPVGMCRQCMVEVEGPRGPMMVVSCMTPVADGQIVLIGQRPIRQFVVNVQANTIVGRAQAVHVPFVNEAL